MARIPRLGRVPASAPLSPADLKRQALVKAELERADAELTRAYRRILDLPSARPGADGEKIRDLIVDRGEEFRLAEEQGVYYSQRRLQSPEGLAQLEQFAAAVTGRGGAVVAEGRRFKSQLSKVAYTASRGGTSPRGLELAREIAALGPQAAYVLSRTGFMGRLRALGVSEERRYADTARLLEMIEGSESSQWDAIIQEVRNARTEYAVSKVRL